jgi:uncharacterized protein (DUF362 family)
VSTRRRRPIIDSTLVSIRRWERFDDYVTLIDALLEDLYGGAAPIAPGGTVVIKPNITANAPSASGGTTHRELVEGLVLAARRWRPGRIVVAEGTGAFGPSHETAFPTGGWREMAARLGVELYNLDAGEHVERPLDKPRYPHPLPLSQLVLEADLFISVPLLKTHVSADYTVALKNSFALTPQATRSEIHRQYLLEEALVDINRVRTPDLILVDGWDGAEGIAGGTDFERPGGARVMLAGTDPVAVDLISRELMGLSMRTRYLEWAIAEGVGCGDRSRITVYGASPQGLCRPFMTPADELLQRMPGLTLMDCDACSGCRVSALAALRRAHAARLTEPLTVVYGGAETDQASEGAVLYVGDCASAHAGEHPSVPGCPPEAEAVHRALLEMGVVCQKCVAAAREALQCLPPEALARLRVTAAGEMVFAGPAFDFYQPHRAVIVGDCSADYARVVRERAPSLGMDPEGDVAFVTGCPATVTDIRRALLGAQGEK